MEAGTAFFPRLSLRHALGTKLDHHLNTPRFPPPFSHLRPALLDLLRNNQKGAASRTIIQQSSSHRQLLLLLCFSSWLQKPFTSDGSAHGTVNFSTPCGQFINSIFGRRDDPFTSTVGIIVTLCNPLKPSELVLPPSHLVRQPFHDPISKPPLYPFIITTQGFVILDRLICECMS